jgi:hypothetical protein
VIDAARHLVLARRAKRLRPPPSVAVALLCGIGLLALGGLFAQPSVAATGAQGPVGARPTLAAAPQAGPAWSSLTAVQQQALAPLKPTWDSIDSPRRKKWVEVADRLPRMPADERQRVQERMAAWAAMTPTERASARVQFQETRRIGADERQARWQAYQALPEEERKRLARAAASKQAAPGAAASAAQGGSVKSDASGPKRNVVAAAPTPAPRAVTPTVLQAKPGASTTTVTTQAKPPLHHQPGLPKIVSTPTFVDPTTLLPRRGPQAAAMRTAASKDPTQQP